MAQQLRANEREIVVGGNGRVVTLPRVRRTASGRIERRYTAEINGLSIRIGLAYGVGLSWATDVDDDTRLMAILNEAVRPAQQWEGGNCWENSFPGWLPFFSPRLWRWLTHFWLALTVHIPVRSDCRILFRGPLAQSLHVQ